MFRIAARNDKGYGPATQVRYSVTNPQIFWQTDELLSCNLPQVVARCKQPCLVWQGGSEESWKCGRSAVCQGIPVSPSSQKFPQYWYFQVAKTGVWSHHGLEGPGKIIVLVQQWKSWENYYIGSATEKEKSGILFVPPASLLTVLRFCMTNVSLNISQLHLWPFDAKSDL